MHFLCRNRPEGLCYHQLSRWNLDCKRGDDLHVRHPVFVRNFGRLLALPIVMQLLLFYSMSGIQVMFLRMVRLGRRPR